MTHILYRMEYTDTNRSVALNAIQNVFGVNAQEAISIINNGFICTNVQRLAVVGHYFMTQFMNSPTRAGSWNWTRLEEDTAINVTQLSHDVT